MFCLLFMLLKCSGKKESWNHLRNTWQNSMVQWRNHSEIESGPARWVKIIGTREAASSLHLGTSLRSRGVCMPVHTHSHTYTHIHTNNAGYIAHQIKGRGQSLQIQIVSSGNGGDNSGKGWFHASPLMSRWGPSNESIGPWGLCLHLCRLVCERDEDWRKECLI